MTVLHTVASLHPDAGGPSRTVTATWPVPVAIVSAYSVVSQSMNVSRVAADGLAPEGTVRLAESVGANGDELADAMGTLVELQRSGALDELAETTGVLSLFTDAMTDEMVVSLAGTGSSLGELVDTAAEPDTRDGLVRMLSAVGTAERTEPAATTTLALLKSLRDDEVKQGLAYMIALARAIGASTSDASGTD